MDVDEIDNLPNPRRVELSFCSAHRVVNAAVKAALEAAEEDSLGELTRHMSGVLAADPCANDLDAWARHGLMAGAQAAWTGTAKDFPPDLPSTFAHRLLYMGSHAMAIGWVLATRVGEGVRNGH